MHRSNQPIIADSYFGDTVEKQQQGVVRVSESNEGRELKQVSIYTDGACTGNPGPGGYGVILAYEEKRREISAGFRLTTNNRMELMAAIVALKTLRYRCAVTLYTDSQYLIGGIAKGWAERWRKNNWWRTKTEKAVNADLWAQLLDLCAQQEITFEWVKGHAGHSENERCDKLAVAAAQGKDLPADEVYEQERAAHQKKIDL